MKKIILPLTLLIVVTIAFSLSSTKKENSPGFNKPDDPLCTPTPVPIPEGLKKLQKAYPGHFTIKDNNTILWNDGTEMKYRIYDPHRSLKDLIEKPDLEAQMSKTYPRDRKYLPLKREDDAGRIRYEPFFRKMYGDSEKEVIAKLAPVYWTPSLSQRVEYATTVNNVAEKLQEISKELEKMPQEKKKYVQTLSGVFNWRTIRGEKRLSPHSFGIALDLDTKYSSYWDWDYYYLTDEETYTAELKYRNQIPLDIVSIFEKHGFIWGGKWYHYDTMHFEYRPELLL